MSCVTPHVGVWIETPLGCRQASRRDVTPHVGVWIETTMLMADSEVTLSLPMWECGLKQWWRSLWLG